MFSYLMSFFKYNNEINHIDSNSDSNLASGDATDSNLTSGDATDSNLTNGDATDSNLTNGDATGPKFEMDNIKSEIVSELETKIESKLRLDSDEELESDEELNSDIESESEPYNENNDENDNKIDNIVMDIDDDILTDDDYNIIIDIYSNVNYPSKKELNEIIRYNNIIDKIINDDYRYNLYKNEYKSKLLKFRKICNNIIDYTPYDDSI
jgi:hypothetical protein